MDILSAVQEFLISNPMSGSWWQIILKFFSWAILGTLIWFVIDKYILQFLSADSKYKAMILRAKLLINQGYALFNKYITENFIKLVETVDDEGIDKIKEKAPKSGAVLQGDLIELIDTVLDNQQANVKKLQAMKKRIED